MPTLRQMSVGRKDAFLFDPDEIEEIPGYNVRNMNAEETQHHIRKMADAIIANGTATFPPITVGQIDGKLHVFSGYCRRRAFSLAKAEGAPIKGILAVANTQNEEERTLDLLNSNDGLPLTAIEKAEVIKRLLKFDWTPEEIARKRGVSVTTIHNMLALADTPQDVKEMVSKGEVSATSASKNSPEKVREAVKEAKEKGKKKATIKTDSNSLCCLEKMLYGFNFGNIGESVSNLVRATNMTKKEWKKVKKKFSLDYLSEAQRDEIEAYFKK